MERCRRLASSVLALTLVACAGESPPPATESETGMIVGQAIEVETLAAEVTGANAVEVRISGQLPSTCHEPMLGLEEPDSEGVIEGTAESWLDPECELNDDLSPFSISVGMTDLDPGDYVVRVGELEDEFRIDP